MNSALVTGATGMVGSHLVDKLLEQGVTISVLVRPSSDVNRLKQLPVDIYYGASDDAIAIRRAINGVSHVFHTAGYVRANAPFDSSGRSPYYKQVNVDFTERLLSAGLEAGVERFVYLSSNSVYDIAAPLPTPESAPLKPVSDYGRSKLQAEELVRTYQARGLNSTIIRPGVIYGPRDRHFLPMTRRLVRLPVVPLINGGQNLFDLVYVQDVIGLIMCAVETDNAIGKTYNSGGGVPVTMRDLLETYRQVVGRAPRIIPVSAKAVERIAGMLYKILSPIAPDAAGFLSPTSVKLLTLDIHLDMAQAQADLGYVPRHSLVQGLENTLRAEKQSA